MTIFHVIKYPLSKPILTSEINTIEKELPELYNIWYKKVYSFVDFRPYSMKIETMRNLLAEYET